MLKLVATLSSRSLPASNISPAALFRTIERYQPTLLLDEAETFLKDNEDLRGIINAGHTRATAQVIRTVGEKHEPRIFSTWCAKLVALIGRLPDTLMDRSIIIRMRRRTPSEQVERLRDDRLKKICLSHKRQLVRWATDHEETLKQADPEVPLELNDRAADNWRSLLAIADAIGGHWPTLARNAAKVISGEEPEDDTFGIQLLSHIRAVLKKTEEECSSADLVKRLTKREDWPWATFGRTGKPLTQNALARLLKNFGVHSLDIKFDGKTLKGYSRSSFEDSWGRYSPPQPRHRNSVNKNGGEVTDHNRNPDPAGCGCETAVTPIKLGSGCGVAVENPATATMKAQLEGV